MFEMPGYRTLEAIGNNGDIMLYRLQHLEDEHTVIVKTTYHAYPGSDAVAAFRYEYELLQKLDGQGAIKPLSLTILADRPVLLMQDMNGYTMDILLRTHATLLTLPARLRIAAGAADCILHIHRKNWTLNELTPSHLLVDPATYEVRLIDIRMCSFKGEQSPLVRAGSRPESMLPYISPEHTGRTGMEPDYRSDFYSLGVTLYEWIAGSLPFELQDVVDIVYRHLAGTPEPLHHRHPSVPKPVSDIVAKCMEKMPEGRYASAYGIKSDIELIPAWLDSSRHEEAFVLASLDISERLIIPNKFYGRHSELHHFEQAMLRAANGAVETVWVSGSIGIGKTAFIHECLRPEAPFKGFIITGNGSSHYPPLPYGLWQDAVDQLVSQLLMENMLQMEVWKLRILQAMDGYGQLLIELVPRLELLIGQQPPIAPLPPVEAKRRFHQILNRFLQLFLQRDRPVVLFFDNMHWADEASLQYLMYLLEDHATTHLLVALGYRSSITEQHPLAQLEKQLEDRCIAMRKLPLAALTTGDLKQLLLDAMRSESATIEDLAAALLHKTEGNPFFLKQYLQDLVADHSVSFNQSSRSWQWDLGLIAEMNISDNAVEYLADKLQGYNEQTVFALGRASFLGQRFDLDTLSTITGIGAHELSEALTIALQENLLQLIQGNPSAGLYKFQHDRIRLAANALVPEADRNGLHYRIGSHFILQMDKGKTTLFEALSHFNQAWDQVVLPKQRLELAELNLDAGLRAKQTTAYETSLRYMRYASALLEESSWEQHYALTFRIYLEQSELEYLCAHFDKANELFQLLLSKVTNNKDKAQIYSIKIQLEASSNHYTEVLELGGHTLELLNVAHHFNPSTAALTLQWLKLRRKLRKYPLDELSKLPPMSDEARKTAMTTLSHTSHASFYLNRKGWLGTAFKMIELTLDYGMTPEASIGFMSYSFFQYYQLRNDEEAYRWGMLACRLSEPFPSLHVRTLTAFTLCYNSWRRYNPALLDKFIENAGRVGLESGDLWEGNQSVLINCGAMLQGSSPLGSIYQRLIENSGDFSRDNSNFHLKQAIVFVALLVRLTGERSSDDTFDLASINEAAYIESVHGDHFQIVDELICVCRYLPGYLFGQYQEAKEALIQSAAILKTRKDKTADHTLQYYYESLVWSQLYEQSSTEEQSVYIAAMRKNLKYIQKFAARSPENFSHKYFLIKAELSRLSRHYQQAEKQYEQAIEAARTYHYIHDLAIAAECYAKYGIRQGKLHLAKLYMTEAYEAYLQWGAKAKADDVKQKFPHLLHTRREPGLEHFDTLSIVQSAQALSGEMEMSRLLDSLMRLMLHNAGAEYGAVIFDHEDTWTIEAYGTAEKLHIESLLLEESSTIVPTAIVAYAARTHEKVLLHHAAVEGVFSRNPEIRESGLKSVLCLPIVHQNKLICLIYLENNLSPGVFTPQRLDVLNLLSNQCAISIANAKLYSGIQYLKNNLEQQVEERTSSLERSMRETSAALAEVSVYEERNRIAQEIHDIVGHTLTSTILQIEAGKRLLQKDMESGLKRLGEAQDLIRHSLNEIRGSVHMLKEDKYADLPVMLQQLIRDTERNAGVTIHKAIHDLPDLMSTAYKKTIYHALQEGLTNGIRHGGSAEFHFSLQPVGAHLQFRLEDRGKGSDTILMGFGLKAMKERVEQLGGTLSIKSRAGQGCLLRIDLPYQLRWIGDRT
ncbi:AAA family ATPase [Paenibacillus luteus]|uniref:AAA family ATPase n=1 Tax=Paenibacillus luteus TaxID=2545753 RepID=UPI0011430F00|nr:AAA family ATPase [Paenibacillus luteus]